MYKKLINSKILSLLFLVPLLNATCSYKNNYYDGVSTPKTMYIYTEKIVEKGFISELQAMHYANTKKDFLVFYPRLHYQCTGRTIGKVKDAALGYVWNMKPLTGGKWSYWGNGKYFTTPSCARDSIVCPSGYSDNGSNCKKAIPSYTYSCKNEKNVQGFNWVATLTDGTLLAPPVNNCSRKYQECTIGCIAPLSLEILTGKCTLSYQSECTEKGMTYNNTTNKCEKPNQCNDEYAQKGENSDLCVSTTDCIVENGSCVNDSVKTCSDSTFEYVFSSNQCEKKIGCNSNQILLSNGTCGSKPYCEENDLESITDCIKTIKIDKSCNTDGRVGNLCFKEDSVQGNFNIDYKKPLSKTKITGAFKEEEYGDIKNTYCADDINGNCTFRLTKIYSNVDGNKLCFEDSLGNSDCLEIESSCKVSGEIVYEQGIRQLFIENDNKTIVAYNKALKNEPIGAINTNCKLSGKVGTIDNFNIDKEIIAAKSSGSSIFFWDSYKRGNIGLISFLPIVPDEDINEGYEYEEVEVMKLYTKGYTGFYTVNGDTYAVFNGLISRDQCENDISGTSFYIAQAQNEDEVKILNMISMLGNKEYNYNNGDNSNGSCVIKSSSVKDFNLQNYSFKSVDISQRPAIYACSPLECSGFTCQYNQCPVNFDGSIIEDSEINLFLTNNTDILLEDICFGEQCDSKKPYYPQCGNSFGCEAGDEIYSQEDGTCVKVSCQPGEIFDNTVAKCVKLDCKDSIEKNGKCYKILEIN